MTRAKLIELTLPFRLQALRAPVKWRMEEPVTMRGGDVWTSLTPIPVAGAGASYDPWEMRDKFLKLQEGDNEALVSFLDQVGYFSRGASPILAEAFLDWKPADSNSETRMEVSYIVGEDGPHSVYRTIPVEGENIWHFRRYTLLRAMRSPKKCPLESWDFTLRLTQLGGKPAAVITTTCFEDSLVATVLIDQMRGAKFQKCQRPDCGITFAVLGKRKRKFHDWDCAHIEAVRRSRKKTK